MADSYVCSGATMKCTMGDQSAKLTVLPSRTVYLCGKPMANISDHASMVNLAPFGKCRSLAYPATAAATAAHLGKLTPMPCVHNTPVPWIPGKPDYLIQGQPALLRSCKCTCIWGGVISITDDGQTGEGTQWLEKKNKEKYDVVHDTEKASFDGYEAAVDFRPMSERKGIIQLANESRAQQEREFFSDKYMFLTESETGRIVWNNGRFKQLEEENKNYLETEEGKNRLAEAKAAFQKIKPNLHSMSRDQLFQLVGQTLGLEKNDIKFLRDTKTESGTLGWHPIKSKNVFLNKNEEANMSMCEKIAVYAHESGHIVQDLVLENAKKKTGKEMSTYEHKLDFATKTYTAPSTDPDKYYNNFKEVDARRYEIVFGKACVDYYNETIINGNEGITEKDKKQ